MKRVRLPFAGFEVDFVDRERGLEQFRGWAEKGTWAPVVVFGPEGCGKSALLRQGMEVLRDYGYSVALVSPLARKPEDRFVITEELREIARDVLAAVINEPAAKLIDLAVDILYGVVKRNIRRKIALLLDDVFQAIGLDKASLFVKSLLNMIEYPSIRYERIVIVVATSEGLTRDEIGRHRWADLMPMWNLPREGLRQLYEQIPGDKPPFEDVWRWTGGNPWLLERLYTVGWSVDRVVEILIRTKGLTQAFIRKWGAVLSRAVEDPQTLWDPDTPEELVRELVERNLIVYNMYSRDPYLWLDTPPPEKDLDLGVSGDVAWQTPLHKEAVRRALKGA